jgi:hypothetical protein
LSYVEPNTASNSISETIADLVDVWKNLSWTGGFDAFWNDPLSTYRLPDDLYFYIYGVVQT